MSTSALPTSRYFVTQLLNSLPSFQRDNAEQTPLSDVPEPVKKQLLSLQVLFPNEFLPALDLLDRKLVTRFRIDIQASSPAMPVAQDVQMQDLREPLREATGPVTPGRPAASETPSNDIDTVHYVRSAQQRSSRFSTSYDSTASYEVRLRAWNCTCPAFAFAAFPPMHPEPAVPTYTPPSPTGDDALQDEDSGAEKVDDLEWMFGGVSLSDGMPPVCKHLLACVLAERCSGVLGDCVEERRVSMETAAGWAAGWGDS
ncbi:hypothetical protein C7974DRAFT_385667 [Boeremia exigua]|uniref:uncharacterized protein n=1 Tax=Boeremia exigua TaxID=749465 RepID=UPI001E8D3A60|nr:uncharacterized protein C7974DRAFT_385667 [Boeremia exigua]KAH6642561.1 hypothetical protein C7974DRAFT_385667 [Boeremia exigua]